MEAPVIFPPSSIEHRQVLPCGVEIIQKIGSVDTNQPDTLFHTVIIAGQHGNEFGPIQALLAWGLDIEYTLIRKGVVTIVRCANPEGFAASLRRYENGRDMNRDWIPERVEDPKTPQNQIWKVITQAFPTSIVQTVVLDLHSAHHANGLAKCVVYLNGIGKEVAQELVQVLSFNDQTDKIDGEWKALEQETNLDQAGPSDAEFSQFRLKFHPPGTLIHWVNDQGGKGVIIEFARTTFREVPLNHEPIRKYQNGLRSKTVAEASEGVWDVVQWALKRHM